MGSGRWAIRAMRDVREAKRLALSNKAGSQTLLINKRTIGIAATTIEQEAGISSFTLEFVYEIRKVRYALLFHPWTIFHPERQPIRNSIHRTLGHPFGIPQTRGERKG
ncbi:hypothetical protein Q3G72_031171 [Acer saccharum]|nr:hypothetical protein Q3G72_031171 [Acer saccharum]